MSILALAIIDKDNKPVLIKSRDPDSSKLQPKLHSALDVVDEKKKIREAFLGVLSQSDNFKIYGLCSATHTKILLMVQNSSIRDNEIRYILKNIYHAYVDVTSNNPFYVYGRPIKSK